MKNYSWMISSILAAMVVAGCGKEEKAQTEDKPEVKQEQKQKEKQSEPVEAEDEETTSDESATAEQEEKSEDEEATSDGVEEASLDISGSWVAKGKDDGVKSKWFFNNGELAVNEKYEYVYKVEKYKDRHGYTVVKIISDDNDMTALLLKGEGDSWEALTLEDDSFDQYFADGTVPDGQVIEFQRDGAAWDSIDEAVDLWELVHKNKANEVSKNIFWENYERDLWEVVEQGTSGDTMLLHFSNISGAGGSFTKFVSHGDRVEITEYNGNASYPQNSSIRYTVERADGKVVEMEDLTQ